MKWKLTKYIEAKLSAKQRVVKISIAVDKICQRAYENGLDHASLDKLVDIVTLPNRLEQGSLGTLIRSFYPASKIKDAIIIKVVASLGHGRDKPALNVQGILLKWLVMVNDVLENQKILAQLYSVFFNLLDTVAIRYLSSACYRMGIGLRKTGLSYVMYSP